MNPRVLMFELPHDLSKFLRRMIIHIDILEKCLISAKDFKEREKWANMLIDLREQMEEHLLITAAKLFDVERDQIGASIIGMPVVDPSCQRIFVSVLEGKNTEIQGSIIH